MEPTFRNGTFGNYVAQKIEFSDPSPCNNQYIHITAYDLFGSFLDHFVGRNYAKLCLREFTQIKKALKSF